MNSNLNLVSFIELTSEEVEAINGGFSLNPIRWVEKGADAVVSGVKTVGNTISNNIKPISIGVGIGLGILAILTGGGPSGQRTDGGAIAGGHWNF